MTAHLPRIAVVGRPNVGKSTLFNRLAGKPLAIVDDRPGVTRDRREARGRLGDMELLLIDTAGYDDGEKSGLDAEMRNQTEIALRDADLCLFLIDARHRRDAAGRELRGCHPPLRQARRFAGQQV